MITGWSVELRGKNGLLILQSHIEESIRFAWLPRDSTDQPVSLSAPPHGGNVKSRIGTVTVSQYK